MSVTYSFDNQCFKTQIRGVHVQLLQGVHIDRPELALLAVTTQ